MKNTKSALIVMFAILSVAHSEPLQFPKYGFSVDSLDAPPTEPSTMALVLFLPATDEFAPNVNVIIQGPIDSLAQFVELSKQQFKDLDYNIVSEDSTSESEWSVEYSGAAPQGKLHWFSRAIFKDRRVYLVTATALERQWSDTSEQLRNCVNSLKLD